MNTEKTLEEKIAALEADNATLCEIAKLSQAGINTEWTVNKINENLVAFKNDSKLTDAVVAMIRRTCSTLKAKAISPKTNENERLHLCGGLFYLENFLDDFCEAVLSSDKIKKRH